MELHSKTVATLASAGQKRAKRNNVEWYGDISDASLSLIPALEACNPGLSPVEYNVVLAIAEVPEKIGAVFIPDTNRDQMELAVQFGRIIAMSPIAFNYDRWPEGSRPPKVGDVVWIARHAGGLFGGKDGREYRIIKDKDIGAVISEGAQDAQA